MIYGHKSIAAYLGASIAEREAQGSYSLRAFARDLALSPAYLSQLIHNKKHLSPERRLEVAKRLGLDEPGTRYFYLLAQLDNAPNDAIRQQIHFQLHDISHYYAEETVDADHFRAIGDWYHVPILEMGYLTDFALSADGVAARLGISATTAQAAIDRLERLGLLRKEENGTYAKTEQNVVFRTARTNEAFATFHRQMIGLAVDAIDGQPLEDRVVMSQTFCIDQGQIAEAKEITRQYLQRMAGLFETAPKHTRTYQLNVQFFNLTDGRPKAEAEGETSGE